MLVTVRFHLRPQKYCNNVAKSMFEIENLSGLIFNDWFRSPKMVLRVEKKLFVIEQPIPPAPAVDSATNELKSMFEKQAGVERFDLIQTFHACKQEEGKPVGQYVLKMQGYVEQLERLGYVLPQDLSVGLILNGLTRVYFKKAATPQVMAIQSGRIQKANKKSLKAKGKDGHCMGNCPAYLAELIKKKKQVGTASSSDVLIIELSSFPTKSWVYDTSCGTYICITKHGLEGVRKLKQVEAIGSFDLVLSNGLFVARIFNMVPTNKVDKTPYELWFRKVPNLSYLKEMMGYYFNFPPENKIVVARYAEFFEKNLLSQEVSGRVGELTEIQDEDTSPLEITSEISMEVEGFEPPQEEEAPVRRFERPHQAPNRLCLNVEVEEHI
ncbi:hypothetical protein Tco_0851235 [Tanacetum coccineum]